MSDDRLEQLWATHEIRRLALRYALAVDSRDRELLLSLWAETGEPATAPDIDVHTVRSEAARWFRKGPTIHFVGNHLVDLHGPDTASGSVYAWAQLDLGEEFVDQAILYQDRYVRRDGRWLFLTRRHLLWFGQERDRHPIRQPPATWPRGYVGRGTLPEDLPSYRAWAAAEGRGQ
jgi:SnoaL-like domain